MPERMEPSSAGNSRRNWQNDTTTDRRDLVVDATALYSASIKDSATAELLL